MPLPLLAVLGAAALGIWALEASGPSSPGGSSSPQDKGEGPTPDENGSGETVNTDEGNDGSNVPSGQWYAAYLSSEYHDQITQAEQDNGIPENLYARLLWQESRFNPNAKSSNGQDRGIAQINLTAHPDVSDADAFNPAFAIPWGARFLASLYVQASDWYTAVMHYNGVGPSAVAYADAITQDVPV